MAAGASAQTIEMSAGGERTIELPGDQPTRETVRWEATVTFERQPDNYELDVDLPLDFAFTPDDGDGDVRVWTEVLVDGEPLWERELGASTGGLSSQGPVPSDLDTDVLEQGENTIVAVHEIERTGEDGSNATVVAGPLSVEAAPIYQASVPAPAAAWTALLAALAGLAGRTRRT